MDYTRDVGFSQAIFQTTAEKFAKQAKEFMSRWKSLRLHPVWWIILAAWILFLPYTLQPIQLAIQDYGRHVQNGRQILAGHWEVTRENFYSFEHPHFPVVNHHWLTGVLFALGENVGGAAFVHLVHVMELLLLAFLLIWRGHKEKLSSLWLFLLAILGVLFFSQRVELRPETIGYVGVGALLIWLRSVERGERQVSIAGVAGWTLFGLFWANSHVSFFFGYGLVWWTAITQLFARYKVIWIEDGKSPISLRNLRRIFLMAVLMTGVSLLNPNGIRGALQPFLMFHNYGYAVSENMTPFYLWTMLPNPIHKVWLACELLVSALLLLFWKKIGVSETGRMLGGMVLSLSAVRHFPFFALLCLPPFFLMLQHAYRQLNTSAEVKENMRMLAWAGLASSYVILVVLSGIGRFFASSGWQNMHVGFEPTQFGSAQFVREHHLRGAAFNNYDIGSYMISQLWPDIKPYTDNRPEAYPKDFFNKEYIPQQFDRALWDQYSKEKGIDIVFFGYTDVTSWAHAFVGQMIVNPDWALVYKDQIVVIFLRRIDKYKDIIAQYDMSPKQSISQGK